MTSKFDDLLHVPEDFSKVSIGRYLAIRRQAAADPKNLNQDRHVGLYPAEATPAPAEKTPHRVPTMPQPAHRRHDISMLGKNLSYTYLAVKGAGAEGLMTIGAS